MLDDAQRALVRTLWLEGPLSRSDLYHRLDMTPNGVGTVAEGLLRLGVIRECAPEPSRGGRPRVPLEIDPKTLHVIGVTLVPGRVEAVRLGLRGDPQGAPVLAQVSKPGQIIAAAGKLLKQLYNQHSFAVGMSVPGFVDLESHKVLFSSATPGLGPVSLDELSEPAHGLRISLENNMHAAGARWMLTHRAAEEQDILLIGFDDGELGATLIIGGRSNRGCVNAANELGHTRFPLATAQCYCGQQGCLERIFSSEFLHQLDDQNGHAGKRVSLHERIKHFDGKHSAGNDPSLQQVVRYLAMGFANAANFIRPNQLVLASQLTHFTAFAELLTHSVRELLLPEIASRAQINLWDRSVASSAETAGWLALAGLYTFGWSST